MIQILKKIVSDWRIFIILISGLFLWFVINRPSVKIDADIKLDTTVDTTVIDTVKLDTLILH